MKRQKHRAELKVTKKHRPGQATRNKLSAPRTADEFFAMSARSQDEWTRTTHVISRVRADGLSLRQASREFGLDPRAVVRRARSTLRKRANGRYVARPSDHLLRVLVVLTLKGKREIAVRDSRQATVIAEHWNAVHRYLETGDSSGVQKFDGIYITDANSERVPLLTDLDEIDRLASAGVLSFESLYARST